MRHDELTKDTTLPQLERARDEWIKEAVDNGFIDLCGNLAVYFGKLEAHRIQGARRHSCVMYSINLPGGLEVVAFLSGGPWLWQLEQYEQIRTVLAGRGAWPDYKELYCNVTQSNDPDRTPKDYEVFVPGEWQEKIEAMRGKVDGFMESTDKAVDDKRRKVLLDQLLIGKEV